MELRKVIVLSFLFCIVVRRITSSYISVLDHGAIGDGISDDTTAFADAWEKGCKEGGSSRILVPQGRDFVMSPVIFQGPCKSKMHFEIKGSIIAPGGMWDHSSKMHWIMIENLPQGLIINGGGKFNGKGNVWWSCRMGRECAKSPNSLNLRNIHGLEMNNLRFENSPQMHIAVGGCTGVSISKLIIKAPGRSPNTDGIHIQNSQHARISDCKIGTGDDCISIGTGVTDLVISNITCGPGHGISIGSLGRDGAKARVSQVHVSNCSIHNSQNGVRIKTWAGGSGLVNDITFQDINFTSVKKPIIVDQHYHARLANEYSLLNEGATEIKDVKYRGLSGSTTSRYGIIFNCSATAPCTGFQLHNVNIWNVKRSKSLSFCKNAEIDEIESVSPKVLC